MMRKARREPGVSMPALAIVPGQGLTALA